MMAPPKKRSVFRTSSVDLGTCRAAIVGNIGDVLAMPKASRSDALIDANLLVFAHVTGPQLYGYNE